MTRAGEKLYAQPIEPTGIRSAVQRVADITVAVAVVAGVVAGILSFF